MTFSIITVLYNNLAGFVKTKESVESQIFDDYEWIVVDGNSNDGTIEYLNSLDIPNLTFLSEKDNGIYDAMNKGILLSKGDYVIFLNGGDVFYADTVLKTLFDKVLYNKSLNKPDISSSIIYGDFSYYFDSGRIKKMKSRSINYINHSLPSSHQSFFYPTSFLKENGYDLRYKISGDYYLTAKAFILGYNFIKVDLIICKFAIGGVSGKYYLKAISEAYIIQRDILKVNFSRRFFSVIKRFFAYNIMRIINNYNL